MAIEITPKIASMLALLDPQEQKYALRRAWAACCDPVAFPDLDYDLWDGQHEDERLDFEHLFLAQAISDL